MVVVETFDGISDSGTFSIIHYDRQKGKVITLDQIFESASTRDVIALVNQGIESKIIRGNVKMHEVESIPRNFVLGEKHVIFYVEQNGQRYEIKVSNESLDPYFTKYYKDLIINDTKLLQY